MPEAFSTILRVVQRKNMAGANESENEKNKLNTNILHTSMWCG